MTLWYALGLAVVLALGLVFVWLLRRAHGQLEGLVEQRTAELRSSEERYERAMLAAEAGFWDWDVPADEFYISPKLMEMSYNPPGSKFAGRSDWVARTPIHPDDLAKYQLAVKELFASGDTRLAMEVRTVHGGETRWVLLSGLCVRDADGKILRWTGSATDVTARKHAEMALRRSDERYARVVQASEDGFWEWIVASDEFYVSPRMLALYGLPPDTVFRGRADFMSRFPPGAEDLELWDREFAAHRAGEKARVDIEVRVNLQGATRWIRVTAICLRDASGAEERWTGSVSDVTERRRAAEALKRSESYLEEALRLGRAGSFAYDARAHRNVHWSPMTYEIFDFDPVGGLPAPEEIYRRVHQDDVGHLRVARGKAMSGKADYDAHYRIVRRDGTVRHLHATGHPTLDASGEVVELVGVVTDVTERKRAEQALRVSEERYARAMEGSDAGHWDWNIVTDEMFISERAREMLALPAGPLPESRAEIMARVPMHPEDRAAMNEKVAAGIRSGIHERDYRVIAGPGEVRWVRSRAKVYRDAHGAAVRMTGSLTDITERKLAADALRASEERYSLAMDASEEGHFDLDLVTGELFISERLNELYGFAPGTRVANRDEYVARANLHPDDAERYHAMLDAAVAQGGPERYGFEFRIVQPSGGVRWLRTRGKVTRDAQGRALRRVGVVADVTETKLADEALRRSERSYALAMEAAQDAHWDCDMITGKYYLSPRSVQLYGLPEITKVATRAEFFAIAPFMAEDFETWKRATAELFAGTGERLSMELRASVRGEMRWILVNGLCVRDSAGKPIRWCGSARDVTERKRVLDELRASEARFRSLAELSSDAYWSQDENLRFIPSGLEHDLAGYRSELHMGQTRAELSGATPLSSTWAEHEAVLQARKPFRDFEYRRIGADGSVRYLSISGTPIFDDQGAFRGYQGVGRDITDRKRAEEELRDSEARFRALTELSSDWYWRQDEELRFTYISHQMADDTYPLDLVIGRTRWDLPGITPLSCSWAEHRAMLATRQPFREFEYARIGQDGRNEYVSISGAPIFDDKGVFRGYQGVGRNITERWRANEELKAMERKLRQAQRLEAMGTLAGGIAHDFNNILGAILGYGEMAMRDAAKGSRLSRDLDSIMAAGERGRALVDRVLAFSRSGVSERVPVHVEKVVREAVDLLLAKLPPDITLHAKLHAGSAAMQGDPTQVHQVLMNLATNAIQAMAGGGTLRVSLRAERIEQARAPMIGAIAPGDYLVLQVADTGTGIPPEILDRIFDPFFTTKEVGTGTGLGLSLVHGIVTELGGAIDVASAVGAGTTFTVYLPRAGDVAEANSGEELALPRGDGQRVLVVDDEEPLVRLATRTLEELGYAPVGFTSSNAALAAFRANPERFDAVLTDERMPGMSGSALIREVRGIRDRIPVVLMSGYVGGAIASRAREAGAGEVLKKPLSARDLATSLARALHS